MMCAWEPLAAVLPQWLVKGMEVLDKQGIQELRLRLGSEPAVISGSGIHHMDRPVHQEDLTYIVNSATRYSPWAAESMRQGYFTISGGHRIGFAGEMTILQEDSFRIRTVQSLCIRIARDIPGIAANFAHLTGSVLIIGPPGWGKTTLLRDLSRQMSQNQETVVIDDRGELFPEGYLRGPRMDVLSFCPKKQGIAMAVRNLGPEILVVDEITREEDCEALLRAAHCGVRLLATAHAHSQEDLYRRAVYRPLMEQRIFDHILVLGRERSCSLERMGVCT